jgi:hypothetical protein
MIETLFSHNSSPESYLSMRQSEYTGNTRQGEMTNTLLSNSSSPESCLAMRQSSESIDRQTSSTVSPKHSILGKQDRVNTLLSLSRSSESCLDMRQSVESRDREVYP